MVSVLKNGNNISYETKKFLLDTEKDFSELASKDIKPGDSALILENSKTYILGHSGEWKPFSYFQKPVKGIDYWTEEDKNFVIQEVINNIDVLTLGSIDENNTINFINVLPAGTYSLKYENSDGTLSIVDNIIVR